MTNYWMGRRFSRRQALRSAGVGAAGLAGAALIGCGGDDEDGAEDAPQTTTTPGASSGGGGATTKEQPKKGGIFGVTGQVAHLDPHTTTIAFAATVTALIYNGLLRATPWVKTAPFYEMDLAKSVEQPDKLTYIFKLNEGAKFHNKPPVNGRVVTAEDVKASLERASKPDPLFIHGSDIDTIKSIEAVDANTVRITTKEPDSRLLGTLALPLYIVAAKEALAQFSDLRTTASAIGTGPFIVDPGWNRDNGGRFPANPAYFRPGLPYLEAVEHRVVVGEAFEQLLAGRIHEAAVPPAETKGWDTKYPGRPFYLFGAYGSAGGRHLNTTRPPFNDARTRQALHLLANRQEALAFVHSGLGRVSPGLGWDHEAYNIPEAEVLTWPGFRADKKADIAEGIKLLEAAGFTKANPLKAGINGINGTSLNAGIPAFERTKAEYEKNSEGRIAITIKAVDFATTKEIEARGEFDMNEAFWVVGPDPDHVLSKLHASTGGRNYSRYKDPTLDALLAKQRQAFDFNERKAAIAECLKRINENQSIIWLSNGYSVNLASKNVRDYVPLSYARWQLERTWFA